MSKEKVLNEKLVEASLTLAQNEYKIILSAMQEFADIESEKKAIAFSNWRQEYVNELTHEYMIYTKGVEPAIIVNDESDLYKYFITNVYNK